jgi:acetoin utilization protein AcuA
LSFRERDRQQKGSAKPGRRAGVKRKDPASGETGSTENAPLHGKPPFLSGWERTVPAREEREEDTSAPPRKNKKTLKTPRGELLIENYFPSEELEGLTVDNGICMFSRHNPDRQKTALLHVSKSEGGNVIAAVDGELLAGYIGIHRPSERERWGKADYNWLYELGAIEVSRNYRRMNMADEMLEVAFDDPFYDDKIVLTTGFTWHWDLEQTGMTKMEYHDLGIRLMGRHGFMEMATDEPNVTMDSANLFLVRIGNMASFSRYQKFASLLFANEWEAMLRGF